jgi:hypothetical protein
LLRAYARVLQVQTDDESWTLADAAIAAGLSSRSPRLNTFICTRLSTSLRKSVEE